MGAVGESSAAEGLEEGMGCWDILEPPQEPPGLGSGVCGALPPLWLKVPKSKEE